MRSLRSYLVVFCLVTVLPSLMFGLVNALRLSQELHHAAEDNARRFAHAAAETMASHLREQIMALTVLARVPLLLSSRSDFYKVAENYHALSGYHVALSDADGNRFLSTRVPFGTPVPPRASTDSVKKAIATGRPNVSELFVGRISGRQTITIDIPVKIPDGLRIVSLSCDPMRITEPLQQMELPEGWLIALVDGTGSFIYRSRDPEQWIGRKTRPELVAAIRASRDGRGHLHNRSVEGFLINNIFENVSGSTWTVLIGLPTEVLYQPLWQPLSLLTAGGILTLVLTVVLAVLMGGRLYRAARRLTTAAEALGRGEPPQPGELLEEFERVARELKNASDLIGAKQANLEEARAAAERANDAKTRFLASASHDLRQPLMAQRLLLQVATAHADTPARRKICDRMEAALAATETMLSRLMDFAALETGNVAVRREVFRLDELTRGVVEENDDIAGDQGLAIGLRTFPCWADSDPVLLGRILRNLVANAIRYTPRGGLLVGIRRRGPRLRIEVWDTGAGIAEDKQRMIFEEFRQLDNPERNRTKGHGLGLAIVAKTAELLGHPMEMRSRWGRGSVFAVEVPAAPPPAAGEHPAPPLLPMPVAPARILVIEDDEVQATAMGTILQYLGHRVVIARDAASLLENWLEPPDLIITDYRLPGAATGIEVVTRLRHACGTHLPALIVTGDVQQTIVLEAASIGCEILHKPCSPQVLFLAIARALPAPGAPLPPATQ